ncbi:TolC family protein [Kiritimatiellota bacterium B12222]|nr:TolC family protein [Kiritimatiellota bacterium B12222]
MTEPSLVGNPLSSNYIRGKINSKRTPLMLLSTALFMINSGCASPESSKIAQEQEKIVSSMMQSYQREAVLMSETTLSMEAPPAELEIPADEPLLVPQRLMDPIPSKEIGLQELWMSALQHSSQIRVFAELPLIRETAIQEAEGLFDAQLFVDGRYYDRNDPVGSSLTTGNEASRFLEQESRYSAGIRKKFATGTEVYVSQDLNHIENNSIYLQPNPQAGAKLLVGGVQPLLNGAGIRYNTAIIEIARMDTELAQNEFLRQMESHLLEISRTYWSLQMFRGVVLAKQRSLEEAESVLNELESRGEFDAMKSQILRANAVVSERRADLIRTESAIKNATERIKSLVNDPALREAGLFELIPTDTFFDEAITVDMKDASRMALENRPEVHQAYLQLQSAVLRREMSINEQLPTLNAFAEAYLAGIADDDYNDAWDNQFDGEGPGYMVGLRLEIPIGNNEANAINTRRRLELRQLGYQLQTTLETILLDVKISVREVETSLRDLVAKQESMIASREELDNLRKRKDSLILGGKANAVEQLDLLLDAQERQASAEESFMQSLAAYQVSLISLQRAQGLLLSEENVQTARTTSEDEDAVRRLGEGRKLPQMEINIGDPEPVTP